MRVVTPQIGQGGRLAVLLLGLIAGQASAEALSFVAALQAAEAQAPQLQAQQAMLESASQAVVAADALPDPKVVVGIENLPLEGPDKFRLDRDFMTMQKLGVMQGFPNGGKRRARAEGAAAQVAQETAQLQLDRITVRIETATAWLNRYYLGQQQVVLDQLDRDNTLLAQVVRAQLAAGKGLAADALLPKQEALALAGRRDELQRDIAMADAALARWLGRGGISLAGEPPTFPVQPEALRQLLQHHPELQLLQPMADKARAELHEAEAARRPDWDVELAYQRRDDAFGDMVSFQVAADLPLFTRTRQNPQIRAKQRALAAIDAEREAMRREHGATLEADIAALQALDRQLTRLEREGRPLVQQKVELQLASYRASRGDLAAVLTARRERRDLELQRLALKTQQHVLAARLHFLFEDHEGQDS